MTPEEREPLSMTTGMGGVIVGGVSAGVETTSATAGAGAPGSGRSALASGGRREERPNRPA
jgi:hypothetical protein